MKEMENNEIVISMEGLYDEKKLVEDSNVFIFLIEDPQVRLDISKSGENYVIKARSEYKFKETLGYIITQRREWDKTRISDAWVELYLEDDKIKFIEYNRQTGFGDIVIRDKRIIHNGTFYRLMELNNYI